MSRRLWTTAVALLLLLPALAYGAGWTAIPPLPDGEHAGVAPQLDGTDYDEMRRCLRQFDSAVGADYFAAVVPVTARSGSPSPSQNNAVPYVDAVYQQWKSDERIDSNIDNIIALGIENRAVAIHPGTRWVQMGFERGAVTRTIDNSQFKTYARNGDYGGAVCKLAEAVDRELAGRMERLEKRRTSLRRQARELREQINEVRSSATEVPEHADRLSEAIGPKLDEADEKAVEAIDALKRSRLSSATAKLQAARPIVEQMQQRVDRYQEAADQLPALRERHDSLAARIDRRPDSDWALPREAKSRLANCADNRTAVETKLTEGQPIAAALADTRHCYREVEKTLAEADFRYRLWTRYIPLGSGGFLLIVLAVALVWRRRQHGRHRKLLETKLTGWSDKLANASTRLHELEQDHGFYFSVGTEEWEGDSKELSQECANAVNHAFLLFAEAQSLHDRADQLLQECGPLSVAPLEEGLRLLEDQTVEFDTETIEKRRRIYLPLTQTYSGTAQQLLDDLDTTYRRALDRVDRIEGLLETVGDRTARAQQATARVDEAVATRRQLALPTDHLADAAAEAKAKLKKARSLRETDPVRAADLFEAHTPTVEEVADRAVLGNEMIEQIEGAVAKRGRGLRERLADLRDRDYAVAEPDFKPDVRLDRIERDTRRVVDLVRQGDEREAEQLFATVEPNLDEVESALDVIEQGPTQIPKDLEACRKDRDALAERIPAAREILEGLEENHAEAAYRQQADNLDQLASLLDELESGFAEVDTHFDNEHYLAATADIETARDLLAEGNALVDAIEAIEETLRQAIDETKTEKPDVHQALEALVARVDERSLAIPTALQERVDQFDEEMSAIETSMGGERPHWPELRSRLRTLGEQIEKTEPLVESHIKAWKTAEDLADELESKLEDLQGAVEAETGDRQHVAARVDSAIRQYKAWWELLEESDKGGKALLRRGRNVQRAYRRAREAWQSELELIESYKQEKRQLRNSIEFDDGRHLGYGVYVDCSAAYQAIERADDAADQKEWEEALERIEEARETYEQSVASAEDEYEREEDSHISTSTSSYSSSTSYSSTSSFSSSSSFSSGGSSFGGSFSGGSSFGGSSSGGSSW